jgi:hypothetical protein
VRLFLLLIAAVLFEPQAADPQAIQRLASTERAFAASALELGVRDAFLTYFADDSVSIQSGADASHTTLVPAKDRLRQSPQPKLPLPSQLIWEPFTGHVSSDGSLGWLTGGYANLNVLTKEVGGKGAYFSVWKHQSDGTWRVWLDEGISLPSLWKDASPFRAAPEPDAGNSTATNEALEDAERSVASGGTAWQTRLGADVRIHRDGVMPIAGRDAAIEWSRTAWQTVRYVPIKTERAASDDLGVVVGGYDATPAQHGTWVRVWKRAVTGSWRIVFETSRAVK